MPRRSPLLLCFLFVLLLGADQGRTEDTAPRAKVRPHRARLADQTSRTCGRCHKEIFQQWQSSMHARSTALDDPIHAAVYRSEVGDPAQEGLTKNGQVPVCLKCHAPAAARDGKTDLSARPLYQEGVGCTTCHTIKNFTGQEGPDGQLRYGIDAYEFSDEALQGPSGRFLGSDHPENAGGHPFPVHGNSAVLRSNEACLGCHARRNNAHQLPVCETGDEIATAKTTGTCLTCHMPVIDGLADHSMMGGHSPEMVARGLQMKVELIPGETPETPFSAELHLTNLLPHRFPTGAPFRNVFVVLSAHDARGDVLWKSSSAAHPLKDDPQAVLLVALGDDAGHPAPPPQATKILGDRRLAPGETRVLRYPVPRTEFAYVKAEAFYDLVLPPMKEKLREKVPASLLEPRWIATAMARPTR